MSRRLPFLRGNTKGRDHLAWRLQNVVSDKPTLALDEAMQSLWRIQEWTLSGTFEYDFDFTTYRPYLETLPVSHTGHVVITVTDLPVKLYVRTAPELPNGYNGELEITLGNPAEIGDEKDGLDFANPDLTEYVPNVPPGFWEPIPLDYGNHTNRYYNSEGNFGFWLPGFGDSPPPGILPPAPTVGMYFQGQSSPASPNWTTYGTFHTRVVTFGTAPSGCDADQTTRLDQLGIGFNFGAIPEVEAGRPGLSHPNVLKEVGFEYNPDTGEFFVNANMALNDYTYVEGNGAQGVFGEKVEAGYEWAGVGSGDPGANKFYTNSDHMSTTTIFYVNDHGWRIPPGTCTSLPVPWDLLGSSPSGRNLFSALNSVFFNDAATYTVNSVTHVGSLFTISVTFVGYGPDTIPIFLTDKWVDNLVSVCGHVGTNFLGAYPSKVHEGDWSLETAIGSAVAYDYASVALSTHNFGSDTQVGSLHIFSADYPLYTHGMLPAQVTNADFTLTPKFYLPFETSGGAPVYDTATGAVLNDPFS